MGARSFEDLVAWQLSRQLHSEVVEFTANGAAARDFHYRDQIRASSASAPANIAEGFARFRPREFARFLEFAKASLAETRSHLIIGHDRGYLSEDHFSRLSNLARAAERATTNLLRNRRQEAEASRGTWK